MNRSPHFSHQTDLPLDKQVLNISVNMARLSEWIADSYASHKPLIDIFMKQTENYLNDLSNQNVSESFKPTLTRFRMEFEKLREEIEDEKNKLYWAEKALTWANILQHRAKLV
ncbi:MAG: hypothetical protein Q7R77_03985 [Candidatus Daviesbacteria bacterium]|nr:hypothetical protein [Candidatus Daviesbacteria bacterium]